jgi:exonuclease SbcC
MRPLELRIRNFRSYFGAEAAFDFRGRRLVGVVGPIGSGKSSLLDAISFALYGKTPTVARGTTALIHQRAGEGAVSLRFEVEGEVWEAVRSLRRKGQSQHALYRYAADEADVDPVETITQEGDVNARVVELLGLEFDAFSRSVLLAQGRFAEFLQARPGERDKVLKGVFGHDRVDRMREVAKERLGAIGVEIEKLAVRVEQLDRVAARIEEHRAAIGAAEERLAELEAIEPELAALADTAAGAANEVAAAEQRLTELRELSRRLPEPAATGRLLTDAADVATRRKALAAELEKAQAAAAGAEAGLAAAVEAGIVTQLERGSSLAATIDARRKADAAAAGRRERLAQQVTKAEADRAGAAQRVAAAQQALAETEQRVATAAAGVEQARQALHAAEHTNMAEVLRAGLRVGEPCPVCAREVAEMPPAGEGGDLDPARSDLERARRAHDEATAAHTRAAAEAQGAAERLSSLEDGASALAAQLAAAEADSEEAAAALETATAEFRDLLGDGEPQEVVEARREEYRAIQEAAAQARKAVDRVRSEHDQVIEDQQGAAKEVGRLRVELAEMAARLDVPLAFEDDSPQAVGGALGTLRTLWQEATADLEQRRDTARGREVEAHEAHAALRAEHGVEGDAATLVAEVKAQLELRVSGLAADEAELAAGDDLIAARDTLIARRDRHQRIAGDLTDSKFVRFLLDEERARLAELGSDHFQRLSSGRYRFSEDGVFDIVDLTAADARRKADSLSGGETFLASLALALALAEMVARTGGRLDSFFLDEGFGALDPEHLDLAMEGIEALVTDADDRLVVVVSHVPEMHQRIEDLIELDRDPTTGDTRVISA